MISSPDLLRFNQLNTRGRETLCPDAQRIIMQEHAENQRSSTMERKYDVC